MADDKRYDSGSDIEEFTLIDIHKILLRLNIVNLIELIIGLIVVVVVITCFRQKSPQTRIWC